MFTCNVIVLVRNQPTGIVITPFESAVVEVEVVFEIRPRGQQRRQKPVVGHLNLPERVGGANS